MDQILCILWEVDSSPAMLMIWKSITCKYYPNITLYLCRIYWVMYSYNIEILYILLSNGILNSVSQFPEIRDCIYSSGLQYSLPKMSQLYPFPISSFTFIQLHWLFLNIDSKLCTFYSINTDIVCKSRHHHQKPWEIDKLYVRLRRSRRWMSKMNKMFVFVWISQTI